ncbi:MAG: hypothetical protein ACK4IX_14000, partial [Candidatus Sericytochromatia bacterium]
MNKALSLLRFQLRVLGAYFKNPTWTPAKTKEFFLYLFYYATNFWYYVFLTFLEALYLNKNPKLKAVDNKITEKYQDSNQFWISLVQSYAQKKEKISNRGDNEGIDFIHLEDNSTIIEDKKTNKQMTAKPTPDGRSLIKDYLKRHKSIDALKLFEDFRNRDGPENSLFYGDHPM